MVLAALGVLIVVEIKLLGGVPLQQAELLIFAVF
jgi:hypothetical protein